MARPTPSERRALEVKDVDATGLGPGGGGDGGSWLIGNPLKSDVLASESGSAEAETGKSKFLCIMKRSLIIPGLGSWSPRP